MVLKTKKFAICLLGCSMALIVVPLIAQEVETPTAGQPEFVDVVPGTPPAPVANAATSEPVNGEIVPFELVRTKTLAPRYPTRAVDMNLEGWVDLLVTVSSSGKVERVEVIAADPRRVFERAAIRAARKWEFEPPIESGLSDSQQGKYRVNFRID